MTLTQFIALSGLIAVLWAFVLVSGALRRGENPAETTDARALVGVWMVLALALQLVSLFS